MKTSQLRKVAIKYGRRGYRAMLRKTTKAQRTAWAKSGGFSTKKLWKRIRKELK